MKKFLILFFLLFMPILVNADDNLVFAGSHWKYKGCGLDFIDFVGGINLALNSNGYKNAVARDQKYSYLTHWGGFQEYNDAWCRYEEEGVLIMYNRYIEQYYPEEQQITIPENPVVEDQPIQNETNGNSGGNTTNNNGNTKNNTNNNNQNKNNSSNPSSDNAPDKETPPSSVSDDITDDVETQDDKATIDNPEDTDTNKENVGREEQSIKWPYIISDSLVIILFGYGGYLYIMRFKKIKH